jgi:hypothetical protein
VVASVVSHLVDAIKHELSTTAIISTTPPTTTTAVATPAPPTVCGPSSGPQVGFLFFQWKPCKEGGVIESPISVFTVSTVVGGSSSRGLCFYGAYTLLCPYRQVDDLVETTNWMSDLLVSKV